MEAHVSDHPLIQHKVTRLRDGATTPRQFRQILTEVTTLLTYEASRDLQLVPQTVTTPLTTTARGRQWPGTMGLVPILRAGLGMVEGVLHLIPDAEVWHVGFQRNEETLEPEWYYQRLPDNIQAYACLVLDPMLATGGSAIAAVSLLKERQARDIRYMGVLAAPEGVQALAQAHPDITSYIGVLDERLTNDADSVPNGYIWPGLGDAGDRQFATL